MLFLLFTKNNIINLKYIFLKSSSYSASWILYLSLRSPMSLKFSAYFSSNYFIFLVKVAISFSIISLSYSEVFFCFSWYCKSVFVFSTYVVNLLISSFFFLIFNSKSFFCSFNSFLDSSNSLLTILSKPVRILTAKN